MSQDEKDCREAFKKIVEACQADTRLWPILALCLYKTSLVLLAQLDKSDQERARRIERSN